MRLYLKNIRKEKKLTQTEVASRIGINSAAYTMIENGDRQKDMSLSTIVKLSKALGVSRDKIISEEMKLKMQ